MSGEVFLHLVSRLMSRDMVEQVNKPLSALSCGHKYDTSTTQLRYEEATSSLQHVTAFCEESKN